MFGRQSGERCYKASTQHLTQKVTLPLVSPPVLAWMFKFIPGCMILGSEAVQYTGWHLQVALSQSQAIECATSTIHIICITYDGNALIFGTSLYCPIMWILKNYEYPHKLLSEPAAKIFESSEALEEFRIDNQKVLMCGVGRGFFADAMQQHKHAISGVALSPEGLVISTSEGAVICYPLN